MWKTARELEREAESEDVAGFLLSHHETLARESHLHKQRKHYLETEPASSENGVDTVEMMTKDLE